MHVQTCSEYSVMSYLMHTVYRCISVLLLMKRLFDCEAVGFEWKSSVSQMHSGTGQMIMMFFFYSGLYSSVNVGVSFQIKL